MFWLEAHVYLGTSFWVIYVRLFLNFSQLAVSRRLCSYRILKVCQFFLLIQKSWCKILVNWTEKAWHPSCYCIPLVCKTNMHSMKNLLNFEPVILVHVSNVLNIWINFQATLHNIHQLCSPWFDQFLLSLISTMQVSWKKVVY